MRFYVSAFGTARYGEPLCGWRVIMRHPLTQRGGVILATFATAEEADAICGTLNNHDAYRAD